ncbi:MAG TPA: hypothetical protein PLF48_08810 [Chitinophagales bacterium]|nr:hypothetical protein [Chitinophagales bacterium]
MNIRLYSFILIALFAWQTENVHAKPKKKKAPITDTITTELSVQSVQDTVSQKLTEPEAAPPVPGVIIIDNFTEQLYDSTPAPNGQFKLEQHAEKIASVYQLKVDLTDQKMIINAPVFDSLSNFFYVIFSDKNGKILINSKLNREQPKMEINMPALINTDYVLNIVNADFTKSNLYYFKRQKH